ncbi:hypothetical protein BA190_09510 [Labrys sp. WJW]|uniref:hypothetical protein n=1 Tax=Labrys sp. WJW TaxID=1737983 RepID=UPI00082E09AC|nr:hypothetical protein [Labrys sp. WJW]OCC05143.1 hypothetical protein BA190_09510 [Labrys sp. WJW]
MAGDNLLEIDEVTVEGCTCGRVHVMLFAGGRVVARMTNSPQGTVEVATSMVRAAHTARRFEATDVPDTIGTPVGRA